MRRAASYSPRTEESGGEQGFWPSYADMMSAVALILFFLMLLSYIQSMITGRDLENTEALLTDTRAQVAAALEEFRKAQDKAFAAQAQYQSAQNELTGLNAELSQKQEEIDAYTIQLSKQADELKEQEKQLRAQKAYLEAADNEIIALRSQMTTVAALRLSIVKQIQDRLIEVMGVPDKISIADNGNIVLSEGVFFDLGSSALKQEGIAVLDELIDAFDAFLADENTTRYVDSIVISGHTDSTGTESDNRQLSTDRANSVLNYLLGGKREKLAAYAPFFCAAGYGETRPVASNDTNEGRAQNRRIEISMILRDESVLEIVDQYLAIPVPESVSAAESAAQP